jgi:hypothetical protein
MFRYIRLQNDSDLEHLYHMRYHGHEPPECTPYEELGVVDKLVANPDRDTICKQWFLEQNRPWYVRRMTNPLVTLFDLAGDCFYTFGMYIVKVVQRVFHFDSSSPHQSWIEYICIQLLSPILFVVSIIITYYLAMWVLVPMMQYLLVYKREQCFIEAERTRERECIPYRLQIKELSKQL